jgi:crotonobetaine/carnitine-CoA ligase
LQEIWRQRFGVKIAGMPGYGLTEMSIVVRHVLGNPQPDGTSGKRFEDYDVRIFDDDGNECPTGVVGEVVMRPLKPGAMFDGYWNRPADTLKVFQELWFRSGDLGFFDEDGFFHFVDRKKDYLRKGGENISSMEMESVFGTHPDIKDVAVHAVPAELVEDEIKITVVAKPGAAEDARALCLWAIERLPAFAVPRYIEFREALPVTPTGKVMKVELRKDGVTATTWDREASDLAARRRARTG